jgi:hypothetical protein
MVHELRAVPLAVGGVGFGISYGFAFIVGGIYALSPSPPDNSVSNDVACDSTCKKQGALLLVPVLGPLLSFDTGPHSATDTKVGLWWSGIQAASAIMAIVGLVGHDVPRVSRPAASVSKISVVPVVTPQGEMLSLATRW